MVALPTDVARSGKTARSAFETVFRSYGQRLERSLTQNGRPRRATAQGIASVCIGGMVVARALVDPPWPTNSATPACRLRSTSAAGATGQIEKWKIQDGRSVAEVITVEWQDSFSCAVD